MIEIRLRQSWINTFLRCPEQARQERFKLVSQKETSDLLRGNAVHHAIETYGEHMMNEDTLPTVDELLDIAETYIAEEAPKIEAVSYTHLTLPTIYSV